MTEQNEFKKDTKQLIIEFVDNCKESFQRLEKLIRLNEDGLMKCFEWSENFEKEMTTMRYMQQNLRDACKRIEELEDRITACDTWIKGILTDIDMIKIEDIERLEKYNMEEYSNILEIERILEKHKKWLFRLEKKDKKPNKCPICNGLGGTKINGTIDEECNSCKGTGIVWS
jgi:hypothetical protein